MQSLEAKKRNEAYKNKWISENKERINLVLDLGQKSKIQAHAVANGESLNAYIIKAVEARMNSESDLYNV